MGDVLTSITERRLLYCGAVILGFSLPGAIVQFLVLGNRSVSVCIKAVVAINVDMRSEYRFHWGKKNLILALSTPVAVLFFSKALRKRLVEFMAWWRSRTSNASQSAEQTSREDSRNGRTEQSAC